MEDSRFDDSEKAMVKTNLRRQGNFCYIDVYHFLISRPDGQSVQASCMKHVYNDGASLWKAVSVGGDDDISSRGTGPSNNT